MHFRTMVLASFTALALVACGSGDDKAKVDDNKGNIPERTKECIAAGDLCKLENNKWVIHKKDDNGGKENDGKKEEEEAVPIADATFDYSDIGVTDNLLPLKKGFGFWHKGAKSKLNSKTFKNNPTLSPLIQWSSREAYDTDLYNFVAVTLDNGEQAKDKKVKFMFDKIGEENQKVNKNIEFFGKAAHAKFTAPTGGTNAPDPASEIGSSSYSKTDGYFWNTVPALVNTMLYKNNKGGWTAYYADPMRKAFMNQEEDAKSDDKPGAKPLRVYGVNAFLSKTADDLMLKDRTAPGADDKLTTLTDRAGLGYLKHANIAWYKTSNKGKRVAKATVDATDPNAVKIVPALDYYKNNDEDGIFPTDNELDSLKYTQFGRLTGEGINPEADKVQGYTDPMLKPYDFSQGGAAIGGNPEAEDWYFARGTEPAPLATLENLKAAGKPITYDGQAVMFGIDYDPRTPSQSGDEESDQSTNSVKPITPVSKANTLLDGKQNFVQITWDPSTGDVTGSVFGVWTKATYFRANTTVGQTASGNALNLALNKNKVYHDNGVKAGPVMGVQTADQKNFKAAYGVLDQALRIEPWVNNLVSLRGKVVEGTNTFGGLAIRVKDKAKGLFQGGFFGRDASEVGGLIDSQTGNFKDENLADPGSKWGGAFGAMNHKEPKSEDLVFDEASIDYGTSTEFFNTGN